MLSRLSSGARSSRRTISGGGGGGRTVTSSTHTSLRTATPRLAATGAITTPIFRSQIPALFYSTERVLSLRTGKDTKNGTSLPKTVYDPSRETENCGVGLVASLKSVASRKVVEDADEMLIRMSHRGGVGCCPASGDGAGKLLITSQMCFILYVYYKSFKN
jgi:hypothetical protein